MPVRMMLQSNIRVMILSTIHPVTFLDSVFNHAYKANIETVPGRILKDGTYCQGIFAL
ncbi:MAG: hypothetical protein ACHQF2_11815 [Flavobacteriales bacterium]